MYVCMYICNIFTSQIKGKCQCINVISRRAVVSCEAKKQHAYMSSALRNHYSELFTRMAALKL